MRRRYPSLTVEQTLDVLSDPETCQDRAEQLDPRWSLAACIDGREPDRCAEETPLPDLSGEPATPKRTENAVVASRGGCPPAPGASASLLLLGALLVIGRRKR